MDLELVLNEWEEALSDDVRRLVIRGTDLSAPGAANFRLAYLAVKLLLRRIQLDLDKATSQGKEDCVSQYYMQAQRAADEIVHLVQELRAPHLRGFWVPVIAFSFTSATTFLLRCALRLKNSRQSAPLTTAKDMIRTLRTYRQNFSWDLADNCLATCGDIVEKIEAENLDSSTGFPDFEAFMDMDMSVLDDFFTGFGNPFEMEI